MLGTGFPANCRHDYPLTEGKKMKDTIGDLEINCLGFLPTTENSYHIKFLDDLQFKNCKRNK